MSLCTRLQAACPLYDGLGVLDLQRFVFSAVSSTVAYMHLDPLRGYPASLARIVCIAFLDLKQDMLANFYGASTRSIFCLASATAFCFRGAKVRSVEREMSGKSARIG